MSVGLEEDAEPVGTEEHDDDLMHIVCLTCNLTTPLVAHCGVKQSPEDQVETEEPDGFVLCVVCVDMEKIHNRRVHGIRL